jgi:hypothetical protein
MVTAGGLRNSSEVWVSKILYESEVLMRSGQRAVIAILRAAAEAGQLVTRVPRVELEEFLSQQEKRWWSINIQSFDDRGKHKILILLYVKKEKILLGSVPCES